MNPSDILAQTGGLDGNQLDDFIRTANKLRG